MKKVMTALALAALCGTMFAADGQEAILEAEQFKTIQAVAHNYGGVAGINFTNKTDLIATDFNWPAAGGAELWARVFFAWAGDDAVAVTVNDGAPIQVNARADASGRWDLGNFQVWHWVRIENVPLQAGVNKVVVKPAQGLGSRVDKIVFYQGSAPAWTRAWLTGNESRLGRSGAKTLVAKKDYYELEARTFEKCDGELVSAGGSGKAVRIVGDEQSIATAFELPQAATEDMWVRLYFEAKNMFEGMTMEELAQACFISINGELVKTAFEQNDSMWHWVNAGPCRLKQGLNLISIKKQGKPVRVDRVILHHGGDFHAAEWFTQRPAHVLPFDYPNQLAFEDAPRASDYRLFGSLAAKTEGELLGESVENAVLPVKLKLPDEAASLVLEKYHPVISYRESQQLGCWINGDKSGVQIKAIFRDAGGELFCGTLAEKADWSGWRYVTLGIPPVVADGQGVFFDHTGYMNNGWLSPELNASSVGQPAAWLKRGGNADGVCDFPVELQWLVIEKPSKGKAELVIGEPGFENPYEYRAEVAGKKARGPATEYELNITVKNAGKQAGTALVSFGNLPAGYDFVDSRMKLQLLALREAAVNAGAVTTVKASVVVPEGEFRQFYYGVGAAPFKSLYLAGGEKMDLERAKLMARLERENGALKLAADGKDAPLKGKGGNALKREEIEKVYGKPEGFVVTAGGLDIASDEYARQNGYSAPLKVVGGDLSDGNGWPELNVPYGQVAVDPEAGRIKFHKNQTEKIRLAGRLDTGFGVAGAVMKRGDYAFFAGGEGDYTVVNVKDPAKPRVTGFIGSWYFSHGLVPCGDSAYFESSHRGLIYVDGLFKNPARPGSQRGVFFDRAKYGRLDAVLEDKKTGVSVSGAGIWFFDLQDPLYPREIASIPNTNRYFDVRGTIGFIQTDAGLQAVDLAKPAAPKVLPGALKLVSGENNMMAIGDKFVAVRNVKTNTVDVFSWNAGKELACAKVATFNIPAGCGHHLFGMFFKDYYYLVDGKAGPGQYGVGYNGGHSRIFTYKVAANSAEPVATFEDPAPTVYSFICTDDKYAYIQDYNYGLWIFDLSNPAAPKKLSGVAGAGESDALWTDGKYAYQWQTFGGAMFCIDVADVRNPKRVGEYWDGCWVPYANAFRGNHNIEGSGNFVFLPRSGYGVKILDVTNPAQPKHAGDLLDEAGKRVQGGGAHLFVKGNRGYVLGGNKQLLIYDLTQPQTPKLLSATAVTNITYLCVDGNLAFATGGTGLYVYDIGNDRAALVAQLDMKQALPSALDLRGVVVARGYAYLTEATKEPYTRLFIVNVKDPRKPAFVKRVDPFLDLMETPCMSGWSDFYQDLVTDGDYLFVGDYGQIECYDIGDSENPRFVDRLHVGCQWSVGRKVGDYLYVPTLAGLRILEVPSTTQIPKGEIKLGYK